MSPTNATRHLIKDSFVGAVILDISKVFNMVSHDLLLFHLSELDLNSTACQWFNSNLCCRQHRTVIDAEHSSNLTITLGVPQGSLLSPLLFSVFINNLPDHVYGVITVLMSRQILEQITTEEIIQYKTFRFEDLHQLYKT